MNSSHYTACENIGFLLNYCVVRRTLNNNDLNQVNGLLFILTGSEKLVLCIIINLFYGFLCRKLQVTIIILGIIFALALHQTLETSSFRLKTHLV